MAKLLGYVVGPQGIQGPPGDAGVGKQGPEGPQGERGTAFVPFVDDNGNLSWTNDEGLQNPDSVNIKGPQGPVGQDGSQGIQGKDAYSESVNAGYDGTEEQFYQYIADTLEDAEVITNKVTTIDDSNTDEEYPSARAVYELFSSIPNGNNKKY